MAPPTRCSEWPTLPHFLHSALMGLGVLGVVVGIMAATWTVKYSDWYKVSQGVVIGFCMWLLVSSILIFLSGLQGCLLPDHPSKLSMRLFISLAVVVLLDVTVLIVFVVLANTPFWILYFIAVFALEFYVLILRTCCKPGAYHQEGNLELPVANPAPQEYLHGIKPPHSDY